MQGKSEMGLFDKLFGCRSTAKVKDLSVVRLIDGRRATVVHVYPKHAAYCIEISDGEDTE